jgi:hypothetical protein
MALRRVGAQDEGTGDEDSSSPDTVFRRDLGRQLGDGGIENKEVVGHRVGAGVAWAEQSKEHLACGIGEKNIVW